MEIIKKDERPLVSINAIAFNHAPYIREALDHMLSQKRDFGIEILVHDDASTDGTGDIIREYARKYPDIVKPIIETENQYSRGITNLSGAFNFPRARGTYIAPLDCDDYWESDEKLALQVAYMESHPGCQLCVHAVKVVNDQGALVNRNLMRPYRGDRDLSPAEIVDKAGAFAFGSMMFRTSLVQKLPDWYVNCPVGDRPIELMAAAEGYCHYIDRALSVYRFHSAGSWTSAMLSGDYREKQDRYARAMRRMYEGFDRSTGGRYHREAVSASHRLFFLTRVNLRDFPAICDPHYRRYYLELPLRERFFLQFEKNAPRLYAAARDVYLKMSKKGGAGS